MALLVLNACTFTTDEEYIRCLQGVNDPGSGGGIPGCKAATVITAGAAGTAAALVFSDILKDLAASLLVVVLTFLLATAVTVGMLWYYAWPLFLSPVGGAIVLGAMLLFWYDT